MSAVSKAFYKPLSLATSVVGGIAAGVVFKQVWKRIGDNDDKAPDARDLNRTAREVLIAALVQGAIFGIVKAAIDRAGAAGYQALTHENPM